MTSLCPRQNGVKISGGSSEQEFDYAVLAAPFQTVTSLLPQDALAAPLQAKLEHFEPSPITVGIPAVILRALRALGQATGTGEPPLRVTLDKRLHIAAGLGGGASDAGAAQMASVLSGRVEEVIR